MKEGIKKKKMPQLQSGLSVYTFSNVTPTKIVTNRTKSHDSKCAPRRSAFVGEHQRNGPVAVSREDLNDRRERIHRLRYDHLRGWREFRSTYSYSFFFFPLSRVSLAHLVALADGRGLVAEEHGRAELPDVRLGVAGVRLDEDGPLADVQP